MAINKRYGKRLPAWVRKEDAPGVRLDSGPYIGWVKNNIDPLRSGRLKVWIPELGGKEDMEESWRTVSYASPFTGATVTLGEAKNNKFDQVAHSYGMWAVPPDLDCQVLCTFVAGDPNRGFWFACINTDLSHYMTPGLAAGVPDVKLSSGELKNAYDRAGSNWPVVEFNEVDPASNKPTFMKNPKPPHEVQSAILIDQGLDRDTIRGAITSSSQRESPSMVFGISTPGRPLNDPANDPAFQAKVNSGDVSSRDMTVYARKGGHTFVMDDGDLTGSSQLLRLRSAGGHQIMLNDSEKVLYIANNNGTAWIEFTGGGHINMYSQGGMHMRTEGVFNVHADNDINLNSKGSINLNAGGKIALQTKDITIKSSSIAAHANAVTVRSDGTLAIQAASGTVKTTGDLELRGGTIKLNSTSPADIPVIDPMQTFKHNDTSVDTKRNQWVSVENAYESIVTVSPAHEPWIRTTTDTATSLFNKVVSDQKFSGVCAPQSVSPTKITKVSAAGKNNEQVVEAALRQNGITDPIQIAAIMAQCHHESGGFKFLKELGSDFSKYEFKSALGNTQKGDGEKYKGRGFIQITGKDIYTKASSAVGADLVATPDLAEDPATAAELVLFFFFNYKKSRTAQVNWDDCEAVTRIVNGGITALPQRKELYADYKRKYLSGWTASGETTTVSVGPGGIPTIAPPSNERGPESARGMQVVNPVPITFLQDSSITTPAIDKLLAAQVKALFIQIGYAESFLNYSVTTNLAHGRLGIYQINGKLLQQYGYVSNKANLFLPTNWTGKDGIKSHTEWLANMGVQEKTMVSVMTDLAAGLMSKQGISAADDLCTVAGMMAVAYFFRDSIDAIADAVKWRTTGIGADIFDAPATRPYNQGRYAIDVLDAQVTDQAKAATADSIATSTSGIDPNDVITFTSGSGDFAHYMKLGTSMRTSLEQMANEFKQLYKRKIVLSSSYRSIDEQQKIYDEWVAAGGKMPDNPTVVTKSYGRVSRPAKPNSAAPHNRGIALDTNASDIQILIKSGLLAKYGFTFPMPVNDKVHIQFNV